MGRGRSGTGNRRGRIVAARAANYTIFTNDAEAEAFMNANYASSVRSLSGDEKDAFAAWSSEQSNTYRYINGHLRKGEPLTTYRRGILDAMDRAFTRPEAVLQHDLTVERTFTGYQAEINRLPVGAIFTDYGFSAATVHPGGLSSGQSVPIRVPRGTRALYISPLARYPEGELLLKRGTAFRIAKASERGEPPILEVVGQT